MTFYRNLSSGTPADTGANETDFVFANTVIAETLGSTPTLGAAGPENLTSPINLSGSSTLPATVLDAGVGVASAPNRVRSAAVVANGAFGTLTFRRTFTNNTGAALSRLRFRIVNMTTAPAAGPNADLRALNSINEIVPVSVGGPVSVGATTLEVPPAQAAGGGLNGTLTVPTVTNATPLGAGSTANLQFTLGVQVTGVFNFCLVPEGEGATASAPVCFAGNSENALPVITPAGPIPVIAGGASVVGATIATVSDAQDAAGSLVVTVIASPVGISVTSIVNTGGTITATVSATCGAPSGNNNVTLQVIDSEGATSTATLVVSVTPTPAPTTPTISGLSSTCAGTPVTLTASSSGAVSYQWYLDGNPIGGETASTTSASTGGSYTVDATNSCGTSSQSAAHVLTVNPIPATPTISGTLSFCTGGNTTLTSSAASGNQWYLDGNPIGGATGQQHVASVAGNYTVVVTLLGCPSLSSAASTVTEIPIPNAPVITPGGPTTFCAGGSVTLTSSASSNYQWYLDGNPIGGATSQAYIAALSGTYTVTISPAGCESAQSAGVAVTVNPVPATPTITPGGPTTFCTGGSVTLTSSSASGNQWLLDGNPIGGATGQQYVATASGSYTVTVTATGCTSAASAATVVTVNPIPATPTITPGGPTTFCAGGSVTLTSSSASGNQWSLDGNPIGGATAQQYIATATGSYTVIVTTSGCPSAASAATAVTVNPVPATPTITPGGPTTFCAGGSVTLTSSSASGNQWSLNGSPIGGATAQQYIATATGNYTVTATASGCPSAASAVTAVTVNPIPATPVIGTGGPTTFCAGGSVTLTSSSASGNQWSLNGSPIGGATAQQYIATASGNYTVIVTTSGCPSAASSATVVTVNPIPATPTITPGGPTTFCAGGNVTLTSSSASGNQWSLNGSPIGGATAQQYVAAVAGDYSVTVTTSGCSSAASAVTTVTVNPNPVATITAPGSVVAGSTGHAASVANAGLGATYAWTIGNGTITAGIGTNAITFTAGGAGILTLNVTVTTAAGCPASSGTTNVTVTAAPPAVTVTSVTPSNGPAFGNTPITVNGTGFLAGATVTLGGTAATNVVVVNSTKITAKTAAHAVGAVNVVVTNTNTASGTLTNGFTYRGQQFDPNGDNMTDPADIFYLVNYLFTGGPAPAGVAGMLSGDANGDGVVDPSDIFYIVHFLFTNGPVPFSTPDRTVSTSSSALRGAVTLGQAQRRDGRWVVPVVVTMEPGSAMPDSLSLRVRFSGQVGDAAIRHVVPEQPVFEISRVSSDALAYLVAFDQHTPILRAGSRSVVVAELTVPAGAGRLEVDGALTMLIAGGTQKATVAGGTLRVQGTTIVNGNDSPRPHVPNNAN
jgi:hypothetical protein